MRHLILGIFILTGSLGFIASVSHASDSMRIATARMGVNVRSSAGVSHRRVSGISSGQEVKILGSRTVGRSTWYQVEFDERQRRGTTRRTGWVAASLFNVTEVNATEGADCANCDSGPCTLAESSIVSPGIQQIAAHFQELNDIEEEIPLPPPNAPLAPPAEFIWPVGGRISSPYGMRRHPVFRWNRMHWGIDIAGSSGQPVRAAKAGVVRPGVSSCTQNRPSRCGGGTGNMVVIDHQDGTQTRYMHLSPHCRLPRAGQTILQGQVLGCVGNTGVSTGPHLHFEILRTQRIGNRNVLRRVNPRDFLVGDVPQ